eukprot:4731015-Amphidinium_carterae.1
MGVVEGVTTLSTRLAMDHLRAVAVKPTGSRRSDGRLEEHVLAVGEALIHLIHLQGILVTAGIETGIEIEATEVGTMLDPPMLPAKDASD